MDITSEDSPKSPAIETNHDAPLTNGMAVHAIDCKLDCSHLPKQNFSQKDNMNKQTTSETTIAKFKNGAANGHPGVELLSIHTLENQSETGSNKNSGSDVSILVQGQNGAVAQIKKVE